MTKTRRLTYVLTVMISAGCETGCRVRGGDEAAPRRDVVVPADADKESGASIFDLSLPLIDQDGTRLALRDLSGHPMVAAMMYTTCTSVCPRVTEDMKAVEAQLGADAGRDVRFVLFSLDPGRDTPGALRRFATDHRLSSRWRLLASSEEGVRDLAAVLGMKYKAIDNGEIAHSAMIFAVDGTGVVRHRQVGLTPDVRPLIAALTRQR